MSPNFAELEKSLREKADRTRVALRHSERELEAVDAELESLAQEKRRFDAVAEVCRSVEALDTLDAGHLFWADGDRAADRIAAARRRVEAFQAKLDEVRGRRESIVETIGGGEDRLHDLEYDIENAAAQEQRRRNNWVIEREPDEPSSRFQVMPWARGCDEDRRFRRSLITSVAASFVLGLVIQWVVLPEIETTQEKIEVPERVARLVREKRVEPPPPEPAAEPDLPEPEPLVQEQPEPEPTAKPKPEPAKASAPQPTPKPMPPAPTPRDTKSEVRSAGILAFRDTFASRANARPNARIGAQAKLSSAGSNAVARQTRSLVTRAGAGSSGGINLDSISRNVGGGGGAGIDGVRVARVSSAIGGGGSPDRPLSGGAAAGRTDEEIQIVFDRYKAALYRLYNRELRKDPTLRGQIVLRLTIEPDGSVSMCELQASDMNAPMLGEQIVGRVRGFDFGAKDVAAMTIVYPIDFLPAA